MWLTCFYCLISLGLFSLSYLLFMDRSGTGSWSWLRPHLTLEHWDVVRSAYGTLILIVALIVLGACFWTVVLN